ncbi:hypothetical protein BDW74DRAFT_34378 [Aspergillus multicolor]
MVGDHMRIPAVVCFWISFFAYTLVFRSTVFGIRSGTDLSCFSSMLALRTSNKNPVAPGDRG